jgi:hypothetical protein
MLEYYSYYPITKKRRFSIGNKAKYASLFDIKSQLPESIVDQLLPTPNKFCGPTLDIETNKTDVVHAIDETWVKEGKLGRNREIEVTKDEIDSYDYFFTDLKNIDWGNHIVYDFDKPGCSHETCPAGAHITSEIKVKDKMVRKYDFVKISEVWGMGVKFLISSRIKKLFDDNGVTGLDYEACGIISSNPTEIEKSGEATYSVAKITTSYTRVATDIKLRDYCKKHCIIIDATPINLRYPVDPMSRDDFQMQDKIVVGKKEYTFRSPWFFISRKVLRILLDSKVRDLKPMTLFTKNGCKPVPFDG